VFFMLHHHSMGYATRDLLKNYHAIFFLSFDFAQKTIEF
jgi:hypothetical protein